MIRIISAIAITIILLACNISNPNTSSDQEQNSQNTNIFQPFPQQLGAVISNDGKVYFYLFAPNARTVSIAGSFNLWNSSANPMQKINTTYGAVWTTSLPLSSVYGHAYKYVINGSTWVADPYSKYVANDGYGGFNSVLKTNSNINWHPFTPPSIDRLVIYELHVESFTANDPSVPPSRRGKFLGILDKTNYLLSLGINAIEIMPIHVQEFYSGYTWGYNPTLFMAVHSDYGTPDDFKVMVNELHKVGIAVILDVVFNHTGNGNNYLWTIDNKYYFDFDGDGILETSSGGDDATPWGNKFALWKPVASKLVYDTLEYYLKEFNVDGFRFDGTYVMVGGNPTYRNARLHLINQIINPLRSQYPNKIWIAEQLPNSSDFKGTGIAQWGEVFHDKMKAMLRRGNFEGEQYNNIDRVGRMIYYDKDSGHFASPLEVVNYFESHDENSVYTELVTYSDLSITDATNASKVGAIVLFTSMGIPMLMSGQEFVRPRIGQNTHKTNGDINWSWLITNTNIFEYYKGLIQLRKQHPALRITDPNPASKDWFKWGNQWNTANFAWGSSKHIVYALNYNGGVPDETKKFVVVVNFGTTPVTVYPFFETGNWTIVVDPTNSYGTNTTNINSTNTSWEVPPVSGFIFMK
ncbi:MAG: alpha-amylase family glycosyl hydrolase [Spirochaetia bacterium]|nr:alpha-amylase family glycosyl hydrolase [Spirochaetota bacterium]MDW8111777.1 alpha-amylase family glycosyl hydrolase [Spirochaetia bacterium]